MIKVGLTLSVCSSQGLQTVSALRAPTADSGDGKPFFSVLSVLTGEISPLLKVTVAVCIMHVYLFIFHVGALASLGFQKCQNVEREEVTR